MIFDPKEKRGGNNGKDQMLPLIEDLMQQWDILVSSQKEAFLLGQTTELG